MSLFTSIFYTKNQNVPFFPFLAKIRMSPFTGAESRHRGPEIRMSLFTSIFYTKKQNVPFYSKKQNVPFYVPF